MLQMFSVFIINNKLTLTLRGVLGYRKQRMYMYVSFIAK